jgi:NADPH:quinone reductase-like Zn-dependent oxidoreductase
MRAVLQSGYGAPADVLTIGDIPVPTPGPREVLVRVKAASVHPDVWHVVTGLPRVLRLMGAGLRAPKQPVPGTDMAGVVEAVGAEITRFKIGDAVFGETILGMQWVNGGAYAEYVTAHEDSLELKPETVSFESAAVVATAGIIALINFRGAEHALKAGSRILINGAGGGVGAMAIQIAKAHGAHVTAIDSAAKQNLLKDLGADRNLDYVSENIFDGTDRFDLVYDVASTFALNDVKRILTPDGKYVIIGHDHFGMGASGSLFGSIPRMLGLMMRTPFDKTLPQAGFKIPSKRETMPVLRALLEQGKISPIIDRSYPLDGVVEALARLQSGHARGRIVITP